jgi:hypothetical protein
MIPQNKLKNKCPKLGHLFFKALQDYGSSGSGTFKSGQFNILIKRLVVL